MTAALPHQQGASRSRHPGARHLLGMQLLTHVLGGVVAKSTKREYGRAELSLHKNEGLFAGIGEGGKAVVWMSHGDRIEKMPDGFSAIAHTDNSPTAAMADEKRKFYGVSSIPSGAYSAGRADPPNFVYTICKCEPTWTMASFVDFSSARYGKPWAANRRFAGCRAALTPRSPRCLCIRHRQAAHLHLRDNGVLRKDEARRCRRPSRTWA